MAFTRCCIFFVIKAVMKVLIVLGMCVLAGIIVLVVVTQSDGASDGFVSEPRSRDKTTHVKKTPVEEREIARKKRQQREALNRVMAIEHFGASS